MRPIKLELQAFGPYAQRQTIDFGELKDRRFFLIHGPTGSGKTSILDGMCFALYGEMSGAGRKGEQMRSQQAAADLPMEVRFTFAVGQAQYQVTRSPAQSVLVKGKQRDVTPKAELWRLAGEDREALASGVQRVNEAVRGILGFQAEQFKQVVLIPQGEFRKLLTAGSEDREKILQVLLQVDGFRQIEDALKQRAQALAKQLGEQRLVRETLLQEAAAPTLDALRQRMSDNAAQMAEMEARVARSREARERSRAAADAGRREQALLQERDLAQRAAEALEARQAEMEELARLLEHADAAEALVDIERSARDRRSEREQAARGAESRAQALQAAQQAARGAQEELARRRGEEPLRAAAQEEVFRLRSALPQAQRLSALEQASQAAHCTLRDARASRERAEEALRKEQQALDEAVAQAERLREAALQAQADVRLRLKQERARWEGAQAAVLAATLAEGQPCPVCGALHHPAPAPAQDAPSREALERLEAEEQRLTQQTQAHMEAAQNRTRQAAQRRPALEQARDVAQTALEEAQRAAAQAQADCQTVLEQVPEALRKEGAARAALQEAERRLEALQAALAQAERCATAATAAAAAAGEAHRAAQAALAEAAKRAEAEREAFLNRLGDSGFADQESYIQARKALGERERWKKTLQDHAEALAAARDRHQRALEAAQGVAAPDLAALGLAAAQAAAAHEQALGDQVRRAQQLQQEQQWVRNLSALEAKLATLEARYSVLGELSRVANGQNPMGLTLQRFVLSALFDDVAVAATQRLRVMSRGRYALQRTAERAHARAAAGLDLEVFDEYTGMARPVSTLSGGESFLASLALALGLADVVQSYAGGIHLETIFVDEGFGTLDPEALEEALKALLGLQSAGRLVGIISHVPELRERIDARLEVTPAADRGSTARFVVG